MAFKKRFQLWCIWSSCSGEGGSGSWGPASSCLWSCLRSTGSWTPHWFDSSVVFVKRQVHSPSSSGDWHMQGQNYFVFINKNSYFGYCVFVILRLLQFASGPNAILYATCSADEKNPAADVGQLAQIDMTEIRSFLRFASYYHKTLRSWPNLCTD